MTDALKPAQVNPWTPVSDPRIQKVLGKLGEEGSELATAACRCYIQGLDECEPETGKPNRRWLEEEIADAIAQSKVAVDELGLDADFIQQRVAMKVSRQTAWLAMQAVEMPKAPASSEDVMVWPDGSWCYRFELPEMSHNGDDYEVIPFGTPRFCEVTGG